MQACTQGFLKGYQTPSYLEGIPLLQYVDNTTFFIEGSMEEARNLSTLLGLFLDFSSLQINRTKSVFIGFGLAPDEELHWSEALGTPIGSLPIRYLGLPLTWRRMANIDEQPVVEKVERCLEGWQTKVMSRGGRLVLL